MVTKRNLISLIKKKRELSGIADTIISDIIEEYLKKEKISLINLTKPQQKLIMKEIRAQLRLLTGRFKFKDLVKKRSELIKKQDWFAMLKTHSSTKERLESGGFEFIESLISKYNIRSITDIGCGINPLAIAKSKIKYNALDINEEELKIVKSFFKQNDISGKITIKDIRKNNSKIPPADLCLILKVFDVLESKNHKIAEKIIKKINCKYLLISFSTKTLSGKSMNHPQRGWIERLLSRLEFSYQHFSTNNEIFYLAQSKS